MFRRRARATVPLVKAMFSVAGHQWPGRIRRLGGAHVLEGAARAGDEDGRAVALGQRLKAWFAALSRQPVPERLLDHVDELDRRGADVSPESPQP